MSPTSTPARCLCGPDMAGSSEYMVSTDVPAVAYSFAEMLGETCYVTRIHTANEIVNLADITWRSAQVIRSMELQNNMAPSQEANEPALNRAQDGRSIVSPKPLAPLNDYV
jgi:hypothetical protein